MEEGRFTALASCARASCQEPVVLSGISRVVALPSEDFVTEEFIRYYRVLFMDPSPRLMEIPEAVPETVRELLLATCRFVWLDPSAAGNRGRAAVEELLTVLRVPRRRRTKKGNYRRLDLAERIAEFGKSRSDLADKLTAIRWVGNVGSHSSVMTADVVMDGLDILWYVLDELYVNRMQRVTRLAKRLTVRKGRP